MFFAKFGYMTSVKVLRHVLTHQSRGFGFIEYASRHSAVNAQQKMNKTNLFGKQICVLLKDDYKALDSNSKIIIEDLSLDVKEEELRKVLEKFGPILFIQIKFSNKPGNNLNIAIVQYEKVEDSLKCIAELNNQVLIKSVVRVHKIQRDNKVTIVVNDEAGYKPICLEKLEAFGRCYIITDNESIDRLKRVITVAYDLDTQAAAFLTAFRADSISCKLNSQTNNSS